ncbi:hypothetical protein KEM54_006810 [Ascosphaera aggregata]|nr:hypothetical protein KEM54_006810 [Ascosphaera aggregata]
MANQHAVRQHRPGGMMKKKIGGGGDSSTSSNFMRNVIVDSMKRMLGIAVRNSKAMQILMCEIRDLTIDDSITVAISRVGRE